jgi:hypothetical protein
VVKVGTPGGSSSYKIVYRSVQGLFREVGLSPNFVWDGVYEVPASYMPYQHRKAREDAQMQAKVAGIQAIHRGQLQCI